jgi:hypothetical protein
MVMPDEALKISLGIFISILLTLVLLIPSIRIIARNKRKRNISENFGEQINNGTLDFNNVINEFNFPVATIDADKNIQIIQNLFLTRIQSFEIFLGIEAVSNCYQNYFLLVANFKGTQIIPNRRGLNTFIDDSNDSFERLYSANILFRENGNKSLTLLQSSIPEDGDHDFFIKDFIGRLKETLR